MIKRTLSVNGNKIVLHVEKQSTYYLEAITALEACNAQVYEVALWTEDDFKTAYKRFLENRGTRVSAFIVLFDLIRKFAPLNKEEEYKEYAKRTYYTNLMTTHKPDKPFRTLEMAMKSLRKYFTPIENEHLHLYKHLHHYKDELSREDAAALYEIVQESYFSGRLP